MLSLLGVDPGEPGRLTLLRRRRQAGAGGLDLGFADQGGAVIHDQAGRGQITEKLGGGLEVAFAGDGDVPVDGTGDGHRVAVNVALDLRTRPDAEDLAGDAATLEFAVENEFAFETDRPVDLYIAQDVAFIAGNFGHIEGSG